MEVKETNVSSLYLRQQQQLLVTNGWKRNGQSRPSPPDPVWCEGRAGKKNISAFLHFSSQKQRLCGHCWEYIGGVVRNYPTPVAHFSLRSSPYAPFPASSVVSVREEWYARSTRRTPERECIKGASQHWETSFTISFDPVIIHGHGSGKGRIYIFKYFLNILVEIFFKIYLTPSSTSEF